MFKGMTFKRAAIGLLLFMMGGSLAAGTSRGQVQAPTSSNSAKACAICHLRWVDTFFVEGRGTDLIEYQANKVVATPDMCFSCHDGSMVDSRGKTHASLHDLEKPVPASITVPDEFPLGDNQNLQCATCHTPHALPSGADAHELIFMRASVLNSTLCQKCHTDKTGLVDSKHNLIHSAPQEPNLEGYTVADAGPCSACHLQHSQARLLVGQDPDSSRLCFSCHSQGQVAQTFQLRDHQHPLDIRPQPGERPIGLPLFTPSGRDDAQGIVACSTCHNPHQWAPDSTDGEIRKDVQGNRTNSFLRRSSPELCQDCHPDKAFIVRTDHDLTISAPDSTNLYGQKPAVSGACGVCHSVHNSRYKTVLWAQDLGPGNNAMERMCNTCHSKGGAAESKIPPVYFHPREKRISNQDKPNAFPLFHPLTGQPVEGGNLSCPSCHNAHQWDPLVFSSGQGFNIEGALDNSFLRPRQTFELCAECHQKDAQAKFTLFHDPQKRKFKSYETQFFK